MGSVGNQTRGACEEVGVYVHFPFCASRCPYCDFATEARAAPPHDAYADAVIAELAARGPGFATRRLRSIYFGGGTPGRWRADRVAAVVAAVGAAWPGAEALEVTVEMNPGDAAPEHLAALRAGGVTRLSLGLQSLDDGELRLLGRRHGRAEALAAVAAARAAGFADLACDLIFGLPGQTAARLAATLDEVCALAPEHLSLYGLTIEEGTPFAAARRAGRLELPDDDLQVELYRLCRARLAAAGYRHYEVSNWARPGKEAVHNGLYWRGVEYLGLGAAAHSLHLGDGVGGEREAERRANLRDPDAYVAAAAAGRFAPATVERLSPEARRREALWLGLRVLAGVPRDRFRAQYGVDPEAVDPAACADLAAAGLLAVEPDRLRLTDRGLLFADEVGARLV
jgi:oxygen-independent coproporphyrinogen-3 oxidase